jgi:hypothetical protein
MVVADLDHRVCCVISTECRQWMQLETADCVGVAPAWIRSSPYQIHRAVAVVP